MKPKKAQTVHSWEIVFPNDANPQKTMFGGKLMAIMDKTAAIAASRYAKRMVVTASTEAMDFIKPVYVGDRIKTTARVVWVGKSSMVVHVNVEAEDPILQERRDCVSAHFNFVALNEKNKPISVPKLIVETDEEKREYEIAEIVKKNAVERKRKIAEAQNKSG